MFSFFNKKPKINNQPFEDLSLMLWQYDSDPTYMCDFLVEQKLDFTLESLKHIDEYLEEIRSNIPDDEEQMFKLVLRTGAYVGEVIRKNSNNMFHWLEYKQALKANKAVGQFGMQLGTMAVLWQEPDHVLFPFGKILKYIDNGSEDSTYAFAYIVTHGANV